jgi:endoplasmic reticulum Man9GlcNAc2 1,2-alpha-mannosidase
VKQYFQTSEQEPIYYDMWSQALDAIQMHLVTTTKHANLKFVAELPQGIGGPLSPKMDHLVCFLPGSIALGATGGLTLATARRAPGWTAKKERQIELAKELTKTCWGMYKVTETGLAPEIAWFNTHEKAVQPRPGTSWLPSTDNSEVKWKKDYIIKPLDAHNLQRPETVESLFVMWRITNNPIYREWGWKIFEAFDKYTILDDREGYSSLDNVNQVPPTRRDNMESFWLVRKAFINARINSIKDVTRG